MSQRTPISAELKSISKDEIQHTLNEQIAEAVGNIQVSETSLQEFPVSLTSPCDRIDILPWIKSAKLRPRIYWSNREGDLEVGGVGASVVIQEQDNLQFGKSYRQIERILALQPEGSCQRFLGGTRFAPRSNSDRLWNGFPAFWFVLPELMITRKRDNYFFTVTALWNSSVDVPELKMKLLGLYDLLLRHKSVDTACTIPEVLSRRDTPDYNGWTAGLEEALAAIEEGTINKVVLARRSDLVLSGNIDPFDYLSALQQANSHCSTFLFEPSDGTAFVGASPERLFKLEGTSLSTEAISGTIARGFTIEEETSNSARLMSSGKDLKEQQYVAEGISEKLRQLCDEYRGAKHPSILKLANVQHLISHFNGRLKPSISIGDIFTSLHPTPAVSGLPLQPAMVLIRSLEDFDRGWYASGVGMISRQVTEMAVAIRSALIKGDNISLFTGAGIVAGSDPMAEWDELEQKMATAINIFSGARV